MPEHTLTLDIPDKTWAFMQAISLISGLSVEILLVKLMNSEKKKFYEETLIRDYLGFWDSKPEDGGK